MTEQEEEDEDEPEYDEHVWLSLKNAEVICNVIADTLSQCDSANADDYSFNNDSSFPASFFECNPKV